MYGQKVRNKFPFHPQISNKHFLHFQPPLNIPVYVILRATIYASVNLLTILDVLTFQVDW